MKAGLNRKIYHVIFFFITTATTFTPLTVDINYGGHLTTEQCSHFETLCSGIHVEAT